MTDSLPDPLQSLLARKNRAAGAPAGTSSPHGAAAESVVDPAHAKLLTVHISGATPRERGLSRASAAAGRIRATVRGYGRLFDRLGITERDQKRACRATLDALRAWDPAQAEELAGIATGSGLNIPEIMLVAARTEILALARAEGSPAAPAVPGECSTLALQRPGASLIAQTWDWHAEFTECWHAQYVEPLAAVPVDAEAVAAEAVAGEAVAAAAGDAPAADSGRGGSRRSDSGPAGSGRGGSGDSDAGGSGSDRADLAYAGLTEFGMPGKIGMNAAGIGVNLNILKSDDDTADGVPIHSVLARILGHARSVDEAIAIIAGAPTSASSLITVSGPDRIAMVEIRPGAHAVLEPGEPGVHAAGGGDDSDRDAVWFCHTNDFQHADFAAGQARGADVSNSPQRFAVLDERTAGATASASGSSKSSARPADTAGGLPDVAGSLPRAADDLLPWLATDPDARLVSRLPDPAAPLGERIATLATVRMDPAARTVRLSPGIPQAAPRATVEFRVGQGS